MRAPSVLNEIEVTLEDDSVPEVVIFSPKILPFFKLYKKTFPEDVPTATTSKTGADSIAEMSSPSNCCSGDLYNNFADLTLMINKELVVATTILFKYVAG